MQQQVSDEERGIVHHQHRYYLHQDGPEVRRVRRETSCPPGHKVVDHEQWQKIKKNHLS